MFSFFFYILFETEGITDKGVANLVGLTLLVHLGVAATAITDMGLASLHTLTKLQTIDISNCSQVCESPSTNNRFS